MFIQSTKTQTLFLLRRKEAIFVFYILLTLVLGNYLYNVTQFQGRDAAVMFHPMKLLSLSYNLTNYNAGKIILLIELYPVLVVIPAGFSLAKEYQTGQQLFMNIRLGPKTYQWSKLLAAFLTTFIIFTIPFLMEIILNCLSFPLNASGDLSMLHPYDETYINYVKNYIMSDLYIHSPYLYAVTGTLFFGIVSGIFGMFTVAFSSVIKIKYNIFLFLPVFILLNASVIFNSKINAGSVSVQWYDYVLLFNECPKNKCGFIIFILIMITTSMILTLHKTRKDCL